MPFRHPYITVAKRKEPHILEMGWKRYSQQELETMLRFANAAAAAVTTRAGALRVMPSLEEIQTILVPNTEI